VWRGGAAAFTGGASHAARPTRGRAMDRFSQPLEPDPVIEAYKKDLDRTLIRENLKLSPEERLRRLMQLQRFAEELRLAGRRARRRPA
jgi:hypothetical protein